ncbi:HMG domain-containing protein 3-like isoform X2 [Cyprinus carpio]|uniref:HMG domain-containing protein 3-like isoform X2 n=1 Tax=Cyprinus carpio TaxID=7962 RepID=A0A9Q9XJN6_CYPCA|nr:HMG domain-containing protein 3-like isoform X2 [Cyprinus carpio]XP_042602321.1 HMG domain-containing protein 3-like isoform X2 [Cyprinus carpio]
MCEMDVCNTCAEMAQRSDLLVTPCVHLRSVDYSSAIAPNEDLSEDVLTEMVEQKWFGDTRKNQCLKQRDQAKSKGATFASLVTIGGPDYKYYISVYEPKVSHYSRLARVLVNYNSKTNTWHCPCLKGRKSCLHKSIGKWCLFQMKRQLFTTLPQAEAVREPSQHEDVMMSGQQWEYPPKGEGLKQMVQYIYHNKKLPETLSDVFTEDVKEEDIPKHLIPEEEFCSQCPGPVHLSAPILITRNAKVAMLTGVVTGISTYCKKCSNCGMFYRYQDWMHGLHNFNDQLLLTVFLCIFIRNSVQAHVSVGRVRSILQKTSHVPYPKDSEFFHAYLHFEALTHHDYNFSCLKCGHHPPVVVMDLHRKGVFSMPVSDISEPHETYNGEVNSEDFWETLSMERIAAGLLKTGDRNPYNIKPNFEYWAPWIGRYTRKAPIVLNTEWQKVQSTSAQDLITEMDITEERLSDELMKLKVADIRKLCKACGVATQGSKTDLLSRLRGQMQTRTAYDKIFQKVWGASGGWAVILCPCGVVYSVKCLIRAESPRDFSDMLFSWKHMPNICIYDFARGLATHSNVRRPEAMPFAPFDGRLAEDTEDNLRAALSGTLTVSLPWLNEKKLDEDVSCHPVTGSSDHYALYDKFHESNSKDVRDSLRKIQLVPELAGSVNTQAAEQLFSGMRKNNYFLNMMSPTTHMFFVRNILHIQNEEKNKSMLKKIQKCHSKTTVNLQKDSLGRLVVDKENRGPERTRLHLIKPTKACWSKPLNRSQRKLVAQALSVSKDDEVAYVGSTVIKQKDFTTLTELSEVEGSVLNSCFCVLQRIALSQNVDIYPVNSHVIVTWLPPICAHPLDSLPPEISSKDAVVFPSYVPGHWMLCRNCSQPLSWAMD